MGNGAVVIRRRGSSGSSRSLGCVMYQRCAPALSQTEPYHPAASITIGPKCNLLVCGDPQYQP